MDDLGELVRRVSAGEPGAQEALFTAAYGELRQLARSRLHGVGRSGELDTTALVHESYLRFIGSARLQSADRRSFFAYASRVMRSVIVDEVRERLASCRGGDLERVTLSTTLSAELAGDQAVEVLDLHESLQALAEAEPRLAQVVEMRYFGGYSEAEIADALELNVRTVRRDWDKARLLLGLMLRR